MDITQAVTQLYNRFPYPPEPIINMAPLGWNWRWDWELVHTFIYGYRPKNLAIQILDAGCGTGFGTQYLTYQNPSAEVLAVDLSDSALTIGRERCHRAGVPLPTFKQGSLLDLGKDSRDFINCVGVLHHLPKPVEGLKVLKEQLADDGIIFLFLYSALGRREISLVQEALRLLSREGLEDGLAVGRRLFKALPPDNPIARFEQEHWAEENRQDSSFVDMYLQVQEIQFTVPTLFQVLDEAGLVFYGFSNPRFWEPERLFGNDPLLLERFARLATKDQYRLIELLDPVSNHYELFVGKAEVSRWNPQREEVLSAIPHRCKYLWAWPKREVCNYDYEPYTLTEEQHRFLTACNGQDTVETLLAETETSIEQVRPLIDKMICLLDRSPDPSSD